MNMFASFRFAMGSCVRRQWLGQWIGRRFALPIIFAFACSIVALLSLPQSAHAGVITVTNSADGGLGSLRAAIAGANSNDTITFDSHVTGTILLASGELAITKSMTITGPGANTLVVNSNNSGRVFSITFGSAVTLSGLTIRNGSVNGNGGGIYNAGHLTMISSTATSNYAEVGGGIYNAGHLTMISSTVTSNYAVPDNASHFGSLGIINNGNGGGIYNAGHVTMTGSTVTNNYAEVGGGIYNASHVTMISNTVTSNYAEFDGGGIANVGTLSFRNSTVADNASNFGSAGIFNNAALSIQNSTISQNTNTAYGPGGIGNRGVVTITFSTFADNKTDLFTYGHASIKGTILSSCAIADGGAIASSGHNLDSGNTCGLNATGDMTNTNPFLGPLANNGGPTLTRALMISSPAINAVNSGDCPSADQRGESRPQGRMCDIGAFEFTFGIYIFFPFAPK